MKFISIQFLLIYRMFLLKFVISDLRGKFHKFHQFRKQSHLQIRKMIILQSLHYNEHLHIMLLQDIIDHLNYWFYPIIIKVLISGVSDVLQLNYYKCFKIINQIIEIDIHYSLDVILPSVLVVVHLLKMIMILN